MTQPMEPHNTAPSDFGGSLCSDSAYRQAEQEGKVVVLPKGNELFIDVDSEAHEQLFHANLTKINEHVGVKGWVSNTSPSGYPQRKHIVVELSRDVIPLERILIQAVLGSDLRRELLSYCRWTLNDPNPTLFFEKGPALLPAAPEVKLLPAAV